MRKAPRLILDVLPRDSAAIGPPSSVGITQTNRPVYSQGNDSGGSNGNVNRPPASNNNNRTYRPPTNPSNGNLTTRPLRTAAIHLLLPITEIAIRLHLAPTALLLRRTTPVAALALVVEEVVALIPVAEVAAALIRAAVVVAVHIHIAK